MILRVACIKNNEIYATGDMNMRIKNIIVDPVKKHFMVITTKSGKYILKFTPKTEQDRYEETVKIARWMLDEKSKPENRRIPAPKLKQQLGGINESQYLNRIYFHWHEYSNVTRIGKNHIFTLKRIVGKKEEIISDPNVRLAFAQTFFQKEDDGKASERAYYWLGDYRHTKIEFASETQEEKNKNITISKIETVLGEKEYNVPNFFRSYGPQWIDFEKGFVANRDEVDDIIDKFKHKDLIVIKGDPASGKSVILRNIGFKLAKEGKDVYVIELKKTPPEIKEVLKLHQGYLFIDDAHLNLECADYIIQSLSNVKILISTRDITGLFGPTSFLKICEYIKNAIPIKAYKATNGIIQIFSEKEKKIPEETRRKFTKNNLWILSWELKAYKKYDRIDEDAVSDEVMGYMRRDLSNKNLKNLRIKHAEDIFLPLSVFYKYEIPLRSKFVEAFVEYKDIENLIDLNEINIFNKNGFEYLSLHHSEIAKVFLKAFQHLEGLGNKIKEKFGENWSEKLFHQYIEEFPRESVNVIYKFMMYSYHWTLFDRSSSIFDIERVKKPGIIKPYGEDAFEIELIKKHLNEIKEGLDVAGDFDIIDIALANDEIGRILIPILKNKIETEKDVRKIGRFISRISPLNEVLAKELIGRLDFEKLKNKAELEKDTIKISCYISTIARVDEKDVEKLISVLKEKIENEKDIKKICMCIICLSVPKIYVKNLVKSLDFQKLKNKIQSEKDYKKVKLFLLGEIAD